MATLTRVVRDLLRRRRITRYRRRQVKDELRTREREEHQERRREGIRDNLPPMGGF